MRLHIREIEFSLPGTGAVVVTGQLDICPSRFAYWFGARRRTVTFDGFVKAQSGALVMPRLWRRRRMFKWLQRAVAPRAFDWLVKQCNPDATPLSDKDTLARIDDALTDVLGIRTPGEPPLQITTETVIARIETWAKSMDERDAKIGGVTAEAYKLQGYNCRCRDAEPDRDNVCSEAAMSVSADPATTLYVCGRCKSEVKVWYYYGTARCRRCNDIVIGRLVKP